MDRIFSALTPTAKASLEEAFVTAAGLNFRASVYLFSVINPEKALAGKAGFIIALDGDACERPAYAEAIKALVEALRVDGKVIDLEGQ